MTSSGSLQFDANDSIDYDRLRAKTRTIATGTYLNGVTDIYAGQSVYVTEAATNSATLLWVADHEYTRDSTNTVWMNEKLTETSESNTASTDVGTNQTADSDARYGYFFTFPATERFYIITGIEFRYVTGHGTPEISIGVDYGDSVNLTTSLLVAVGPAATYGVSDGIKKLTNISSKFIRGGTTVFPWVASNNGLGFGIGSGPDGYEKTGTTINNVPKYNYTNAIVASQVPYIKLYYRGYY